MLSEYLRHPRIDNFNKKRFATAREIFENLFMFMLPTTILRQK